MTPEQANATGMSEKCPGCGVLIEEASSRVERCGRESLASQDTGLGHCPISCELALRKKQISELKELIAQQRECLATQGALLDKAEEEIAGITGCCKEDDDG